VTEPIPSRGWFGKDWGARVCRTTPHLPTPLGEVCHECEQPVLDGECGVILPYHPTYGLQSRSPFHLKCLLHNLGIDHLGKPAP
jgi:hypothetical protein